MSVFAGLRPLVAADAVYEGAEEDKSRLLRLILLVLIGLLVSGCGTFLDPTDYNPDCNFN